MISAKAQRMKIHIQKCLASHDPSTTLAPACTVQATPSNASKHPATYDTSIPQPKRIQLDLHMNSNKGED